MAKLRLEGTALRDEVRELAQRLKLDSHLRVGVLGAAAEAKVEGADITMSELAAIHEFGTRDGRIPSRSWLRSTADAKYDDWLRLLVRGLRLTVRKKMPIETVYQLLGVQVVADIQAKIRSNIAPPLSPSTIRRKGSSVALIDSGRFVQSITAAVMRNDAE